MGRGHIRLFLHKKCAAPVMSGKEGICRGERKRVRSHSRSGGGQKEDAASSFLHHPAFYFGPSSNAAAAGVDESVTVGLPPFILGFFSIGFLRTDRHGGENPSPYPTTTKMWEPL